MVTTKNLLVRMEPDLFAAVTATAEREDRSRSSVVREALRAYIRSPKIAGTVKTPMPSGQQNGDGPVPEVGREAAGSHLGQGVGLRQSSSPSLPANPPKARLCKVHSPAAILGGTCMDCGATV